MRTLISCLVLALATPAFADVTADKLKACERTYQAEWKAAKAASPAGFKPDRPRGFKADAVAKCLNG